MMNVFVEQPRQQVLASQTNLDLLSGTLQNVDSLAYSSMAHFSRKVILSLKSRNLQKKILVIQQHIFFEKNAIPWYCSEEVMFVLSRVL